MVQLWMSRTAGCSGLVALMAVDDGTAESSSAQGPMPRSVWVLDEAAAQLAAGLLHDAVETAAAAGSQADVDLDDLVRRAAETTGHPIW